VAGTPSTNFRDAPCDGNADHHKPFYDGQVGTHGLWLTPDFATLLATNRISSTVVAVDIRAIAQCATLGCPDTIKAYAPVGREPHLATVRPGTGPVYEAWVAVRGEHYVDVLKVDPTLLGSTTAQLEPPDRLPRTVPTVDTALGPSMVSFTSDGQYAFVAAGKQAVVQRYDANTRLPSGNPKTVVAPFTPFGLVAPPDLSGPLDDRGEDMYLVHKTAGKLSILKNLRNTDMSFAPLAGGNVWDGVPIGSTPGCGNHVAFAGDFAYITTGGPAPCAPAGLASRQGGIVVVDRAKRQIVAASQGLLNQPLSATNPTTLLQAWANLGVDVAPILSAATSTLPNAAYNDSLQAKAAGSITDWTGDPHGIWASPDGRYVFIGHESGNRVTTIFRADPRDPSQDVVAGFATAGGPGDTSASACRVTTPAGDIDTSCMRQPIDVVFQPLP
jgi:hypothetical protein